MIKIAAVSCLCHSKTIWHQHRHTTKMKNITLPNLSHKHRLPKLINPSTCWTDPVLLGLPPSPAHPCRAPSSIFSHRDLQGRDGEDVFICARWPEASKTWCAYSRYLQFLLYPSPGLILAVVSGETGTHQTSTKPFLLHERCTSSVWTQGTAHGNTRERWGCGKGWRLALLAKILKTS